jgi:hypothetical protein
MNFTYWTGYSKRRNSTAKPATTGTDAACVLKEDTSITAPTIKLQGHTFFNVTYGYIADFGRYYFIRDIRTVGSVTEINLVVDVLATYKADILASTQYVCYSANAAKTWLSDTRIPLSKLSTVSRQGESTSGIFYTTGFYVLTVNGKNGCVAYCMAASMLDQLIQSVDTWRDNSIQGILTGSTGGVTYDWSTPEDCLESLGKMMAQGDVVGNAYANAPSCIRSCIWVPFDATAFDTGTAQNIYLGEYDTGVPAFRCKTGAVVFSKSITIPWQHTDWRRGICEELYLYLPFVGNIHLSSDSLTHASTLDIQISLSATDGTVCYRVSDGTYTIGTYGGSCCANYPIGINQQASAGQILQSGISGIEKQFAAAINSSISPISMGAVAANEMFQLAISSYDIINTTYSTNPSTIGSFGGGAGVGVGVSVITLTSVSHETIVTPATMAATMGRPTMEPMSLSTLTGYCQCANGHISAAAQADELNALDEFINTGFYIE